MKRILRTFVVDTTALYIVSQTASGIIFQNGVTTLMLTGVVLALVTLFIKPISKILLLPINLVTFGLFRWVTAVIALYIVDLILPTFSISGFNFPGFSNNLFTIPAISLGGILAYTAYSLAISIASSFVFWLIK